MGTNKVPQDPNDCGCGKPVKKTEKKKRVLKKQIRSRK